MVKVNVLLGLTLTGSALWLVTLNEDPFTASFEMRTAAEPSFVTVTLVLALCPTVTEPNVTDCVETLSVLVTVVLVEEELLTLEVQPFSMRPQITRHGSAIHSRHAHSLPTQKVGRNALLERAIVTI
jgi:hypothetical protein